MTDLKTLKNFYSEEDWDGYLTCSAALTVGDFKKRLRQEAIKWIKAVAKPSELDLELIKFRKKSSEEYYLDYDGVPDEKQALAITQIMWIMHFFNISEEDLK